MDAGKLIEVGTVADIFERPQHEHTRELLAALPVIGGRRGLGEAV